MIKQAEFKSIDFGQLLRATEGLTQWRSMGLMFLTLLVSGLLFGLGVRLGIFGILVLGLLSAVVSAAGTAAVGIMLLDKAKNQEPRSLQDAFMAGLACVPKIILYFLAVMALFVVLFIVAGIFYYICKIPFIGPVLLFFVHPALVLLTAAIFIVLVWLVAPILMPALWDGRGLKAGFGLVLEVARARLIQVVVMVLILYLLLGVVYLVIASGFLPGFMMMSGLASFIMGGSGMMMGALGSPSLGSSMGSVLALSLSSLVVISIMMALLLQVMFMGYNLIYLMATDGLDENGAEESLKAGIAAAREKARQAQERAHEVADKLRAAASTDTPAPAASPAGGVASVATPAASVAPVTAAAAVGAAVVGSVAAAASAADSTPATEAPAAAVIPPVLAPAPMAATPDVFGTPVAPVVSPVVAATNDVLGGVQEGAVTTSPAAAAEHEPPAAPVVPAAVVAAATVAPVPAPVSAPVSVAPSIAETTPVAASAPVVPSAPLPRCNNCFETVGADDLFCEHCGHKVA